MWGLMSFIRAKTLIKSIEPTTYSTPHWDSRPSHAGGRRLSYHCVIFAPPLFSFIKAVTVSYAESSLCCGEAGKKKKESARGTMGRGKREEMPRPYNGRFSCRICGSVVLASPGNHLDALKVEDNSIKG